MYYIYSEGRAEAMTNTLTTKRSGTELRKQFYRALEDLKALLPLFSKGEHIGVIFSYLKAYKLLEGNDSAKGRLIYLLGEMG
jgi:hypothetical protein